MPVLKCKMCGGNLNVQEGQTVCTCEYCGTTQTIPVLDDEKKNKLFERANRLRFNNEFDKAYSVYQDIINDFPQEAEAYWGLLLSKYGIEYVEDPYTHKRIPTCHRSSFESIFDDQYFDLVMENCDPVSRDVYRDEAKAIEEIRKGIIEVSSKEEPYDIFICYKETDEYNNRTVDSVIAQDVYNALAEKGYRVFFSRISLEDKLGQEYEPYIFAAINSAKVMLVFGTRYEYFNAVWVKNEWFRFLQLIAKGEKKTLIPCYRDIDAYDMPKEFIHLQSQDMGKVGAIQDLVRGIDKILGKNRNIKESLSSSIDSSTANVDSLLKRAHIFLNDKDFSNANTYAEKVLDVDPENAEAYLVKTMVDYQINHIKDLEKQRNPLSENRNFKNALSFSKNDLNEELEKLISYNTSFVDEANKEDLYNRALSLNSNSKLDSLINARDIFAQIEEYKDSSEQLKLLNDKINTLEADTKKKNSRIIKIMAIVSGIMIVSLISLFFINPDYFRYISCSMKNKSEKYLCYCEIDVLDSKDKARTSLENYLEDLYQKEQYNDLIGTFTKNKKIISTRDSADLIYVINPKTRRIIAESYFQIAFDENSSVAYAKSIKSYLQNSEYWNKYSKEFNEKLDNKIYKYVMDDIDSKHSDLIYLDYINNLEILYKGENSKTYKGDNEIYNALLKTIHNYYCSSFDPNKTAYTLHSTWNVNSDVIPFTTATEFKDNYLQPLKEVYPSFYEKSLYDFYKLIGYWSGDGYYFEMNDNGESNYNLPFPSGKTDHYHIKNHIFYEFIEGDNYEEIDSRDVFKFSFDSDTSMSVYCYKNGNTYKLFKNK